MMSDPNSSYNLTVPDEFNHERIDRFLAVMLEDGISRSLIQRLAHEGRIRINGTAVKPGHRIKAGDSIDVDIIRDEPSIPGPENIPLDIVYMDDDITVINKPPGLVTHGGAGISTGTLVNGLLFHVKKLADSGDPSRPGIVHRLDRDTSGLIVAARNDEAYAGLVRQFSDRSVEKRYCTVVSGKPRREHDTIDSPLARHKRYRHKMTIDPEGREALTEFTIMKVWNLPTGTFTMLDVTIHTGRTHQIRVHLASAGNPVIGDRIYSKKWEKYRVPFMLLASVHLGFNHPVTGIKMEFNAELPQHMLEFIERLNMAENQ